MNKSSVAIFLFLLVCSSKTLDLSEVPAQFVIWNVGQGSWSTEIQSTVCRHFDFGGEQNPISAVKRACRGKKNILVLSHFDWDHRSFLASIKSNLDNVCVAGLPNTGQPKRQKSFEGIPLCQPPDLEMHLIYPGRTQQLSFLKKIPENDFSRIYYLQKMGWLIPGDSSIHQEKVWITYLKKYRPKFLLLGHHGSLTATGNDLLKAFPWRQAVASARFKKYKHPHRDVIDRLRKNKTPLLLTEKWGHLRFLKSREKL